MQDYLGKDIYPFHMPGHKRNHMFFPVGLADFDMTEIPGMDILHSATGIIRHLQDAIADFYGADESFLLVNGSTAGIIAAICATCNDGSKLYAARNGHVSMYNGMALAGASPIYIMPEITPDGLVCGINPNMVDNIEHGATVLIVSPTYEGFVSDIEAIAEKVHARDGILIVDEAHGAHFSFHDMFPTSALDLGADIVVQSFHKTLPALGQMAVLHVKGTRVDLARINFFLQAVQTTSPSYMLMAQLDYALNMLWKRPELFDMYANRLTALRNALAAGDSDAIRLSGTEKAGQYGIYDIDMGKLLFHVPYDISKILASDYRIQIEMAGGNHMLAMTSVADTDEGMQRLWAAIGSLNIKLTSQKHMQQPIYKPINPEIVIPPRQAISCPTKLVPWEESPGHVAAEIVATYPPGIAYVAPGERIPEGLPKLATHIRVVV